MRKMGSGYKEAQRVCIVGRFQAGTSAADQVELVVVVEDLNHAGVPVRYRAASIADSATCECTRSPCLSAIVSRSSITVASRLYSVCGEIPHGVERDA